MSVELETFVVGRKIELKATFKNDATPTPQPTNPDDVTFRLKDSRGNVVEFESPPSADLLNPSAGVWIVNHVALYGGRHYVKFTGVGTVDSAVQGYFDVEYDPTA